MAAQLPAQAAILRGAKFNNIKSLENKSHGDRPTILSCHTEYAVTLLGKKQNK